MHQHAIQQQLAQERDIIIKIDPQVYVGARICGTSVYDTRGNLLAHLGAAEMERLMALADEVDQDEAWREFADRYDLPPQRSNTSPVIIPIPRGADLQDYIR